MRALCHTASPEQSCSHSYPPTGQNIDMIDSLFAGGFLGTTSDLADGTLRFEEFRYSCNTVKGFLGLADVLQFCFDRFADDI